MHETSPLKHGKLTYSQVVSSIVLRQAVSTSSVLRRYTARPMTRSSEALSSSVDRMLYQRSMSHQTMRATNSRNSTSRRRRIRLSSKTCGHGTSRSRPMARLTSGLTARCSSKATAVMMAEKGTMMNEAMNGMQLGCHSIAIGSASLLGI